MKYILMLLLVLGNLNLHASDKVTCYKYNAKKGKFKESKKKECKRNFFATQEEALADAEQDCGKKKKFVWMEIDGAKRCIKDTKLVGNALKAAGADKKLVRKCKKAVRKGRKNLPGASVEEALEFMKKQGCDLEAFARSLDEQSKN